MSRIAYVNGRYVAHRRRRCISRIAAISSPTASTRSCIAAGSFIDEALHLDRLDRSLARTAHCACRGARRAGARHARGDAAQRRRATASSTCRSPAASRRATMPSRTPARPGAGRDHAPHRAPTRTDLGRWTASGHHQPDIRWERCDIKSIALLPNVLGQAGGARRAAPIEAGWSTSDGCVTEGASTNAWIVDAARRAAYPRPDNAILAGITRAALLAVTRRAGIELVERPFTLAEAKKAGGLHHQRHRLRDAGGEDRRRAVGDGKVGPIGAAAAREYVARAT